MMTETESFVQLKKRDLVYIGIKDEDGNDTGERFVFDLEDIELPLRLVECDEMHKKNITNLRDKFIIIDKKEDKKGKKVISWKQEEKIKALNEFYKNEMVALDKFIGEGKTQRILDLMHSKPYYEMFEDIIEMINPIIPKLKTTADDIKKKIIDKYSNKDSEVLK